MKNPLKFSALLLLICSGSFFTACISNVEEELEPIVEVSFKTNVQPIIDARCTTCHSQSGGQSPDLDGFSNVKAQAGRVNARVAAGTMPPSGALPDAQIQIIVDWVDEGALDN